MIRFIDLGKQIGLDDEWPREFAFYNTVPDLFIQGAGSQVWDNWKDCELDLREDHDDAFVARCFNLLPTWVPFTK